jgi:cobalt-zinc-cadmium efflux system outer membrane protein
VTEWRLILIRGLVLALALWPSARRANAQGPTIPPEGRGEPGSTQSSLGVIPGAGAIPFGNTPGAGEDVLGGRAGTSFPRVPSSIMNPSAGATRAPVRQPMTPPPTLPIADIPLYGPLDLPTGAADEGPPNGLTLDMAIERLVRENLDLRSRFFEIPQAQADVLTASLRANPLLYADSQLIPYGQYSSGRPGGPLQYDLNVTYPLDVTRKRRARIEVAVRAKRVLEAQYQDAVRLQINNLYTAFVDVVAARETVQIRRTALEGLAKLQEVTQTLYKRSGTTSADLGRVIELRDTAEILLMEDEEALRRAKRTLATLLAIPPDQAEALEVRGTTADRVPPPPPSDELIRIALSVRPDLVAYRLGVQRAQADVRLAHANRLQDVYVLYQPYTFQDNQPTGNKSATSWALGMTVPLPLYNRNQGAIQRAHLNVSQTQVEVAAMERQVVNEVQQADRDYAVTRAAVQQIEQRILPRALKTRKDKYELFVGGEEDVVAYLNAIDRYNQAVRLYRETAVRHRRSMLVLNTALGQRVLP